MTRKKYYFLIAFLAFLLIALIYFFGSAANVVPGWHTIIYPPYYTWVLIVIMTLFFGAIGYVLYIKQTSKTNWVLYIIYFLTTTSIYFFTKFPLVFLQYQQDDQEVLFNARTLVRLLPIANWVLIIIQILSVGYISCLILLHKKRA